jgi:hypothetical protein
MASLFSSSAYSYIDIVLAYGQASGVPIESREFPCYCFYWEYTKAFGIFDPNSYN